MAGGGGTRFWPLSRQTNPKQLLNLSGHGLMINETIDRLLGIVEQENIFIVTNVSQAEKMKASVGERMLSEHILTEPKARNTAACIGYAAMEIIQKHGDGIMCILPSDHYIKNIEEFQNILNKAITVAEQEDRLVTIGIKPTFPATGYGYINYEAKDGHSVYEVYEFVEKPNYEAAKQYVESPGYAWNSGMFVWKASTILQSFERFLPKLYQILLQIGEAMGSMDEYSTLQELYRHLPSISIDYGVMERADNVSVILGNFGWSDVGSWDNLGALYELDEAGNIFKGEQVNISTKSSICYAQNRLIATVGVENMIIVETSDAVLVCRKDLAQRVKDVVDELKLKGLEKYLE